MQKTIDATQVNVSGTARLKLYKGSCVVTGRKAVKSLYSEKIATFEEGDGFRQDDAEGFIRLNALRLKIYSEVFGKK